MVHVFKNWKLLFENIYGNTCEWKSMWKYVKCCLKTKNGCLKIQTKHPINIFSKPAFIKNKIKKKKEKKNLKAQNQGPISDSQPYYKWSQSAQTPNIYTWSERLVSTEQLTVEGGGEQIQSKNERGPERRTGGETESLSRWEVNSGVERIRENERQREAESRENGEIFRVLSGFICFDLWLFCG